MEKFNIEKHWDKFKNGNLVVHCSTERFANEFLEYCCKNNITMPEWRENKDSCWSNYAQDMSYRCNNGNINYGSKQFYIKEYSMEVIEFQGFNIVEQFNVEKHWEDFKLGKVAVNCKTKELSDEFKKYCSDKRMKWCSGTHLDELDYWYNYGSKLCYVYDSGMSNSYAEYFQEDGKLITEFNGFKPENNIPTITSKEIIEVIYHGTETIVLIKANHKYYKGVSSCHYTDTYDKEVGFGIALSRARDKQKGGRY